MKKMVLGLSLSLAALGFLMSPVMAATSPPQVAPVLSAADQAFIASLAVLPAGAPAPEPAAKRPHIAPKDMCTANCWNGGTVSCSGTGTCTAVDGSCPEPGHVVCNGVTTSCSPCTDCDTLASQCDDSCYPCAVKFFQCSPYRCRCDFIHCYQ